MYSKLLDIVYCVLDMPKLVSDMKEVLAAVRPTHSQPVPVPACAAASEKNETATTSDKVCVQFISLFSLARSNLTLHSIVLN